MSIDGRKIVPPISINDLQRLFGVNGEGDLFKISQLVKVNIFSKNKFVSYNKYFAQNVDSSLPNYDAEWYKGTLGNCGIKFPTIDSISKVSTVNWEYDRPTGGSSMPIRLTDMANYNDAAVPFLQYGGMDIKINTYALPNSFTIHGNIVESDPYQLGYTDFNGGKLSEMYLTSCIKKGSSYWIKSAAKKIFENEDGLTITWDWAEFGENPPRPGTYDIYMVLSPTQYVPRTALTDITNGTIIPVWHDSIYRNPFQLRIESTPPVSFIISRIGATIGGTGMNTPKHFQLDNDKLSWDDKGNPVYTGTNALRSSGYCFLEIEATNNFDTPQQFNAADIYIEAYNFRNELSASMPIKLYLDIDLKTMINGSMSIPAKSTVMIYAGRNIFNIDSNGKQFFPEDNAVIAPAGVYLTQGLNGGTLGRADGMVVKSY